MEEIVERLESEGGEWAVKTLGALARMSPTALKTAFRQIREGGKRDFEGCMAMEYRISQRIVPGH